MSPNTINGIEIKLKYGELSPVINWCQRNCIGNWSYDIKLPPGNEKGEYLFYFENDKDLTAFTIWKT